MVLFQKILGKDHRSLTLSWIPSFLQDKRITFPRWAWYLFLQRQSSECREFEEPIEVHTFTELYKAMFQVSKHPQHLPRLPCSRKTKRTQANIAFMMTILQTANFSASHVWTFCRADESHFWFTLYDFFFFHFPCKDPCFQIACSKRVKILVDI